MASCDIFVADGSGAKDSGIMCIRELTKRLFFTLVLAGVLAITYTVSGAAQTASSVSERRLDGLRCHSVAV